MMFQLCKIHVGGRLNVAANTKHAFSNVRRTCGFPKIRSYANFDRSRLVCRAALVEKKCQPCEGGGGETLDRKQAEGFLNEVKGWEIFEDENQYLRIRRQWRSKNFVKGLELFGKIAEVAEEQGHHPDLHLVGWNRISVELWTHSLNGLTENDFIMAAKIDAIDKDDLIRKKKPKPSA